MMGGTMRLGARATVVQEHLSTPSASGSADAGKSIYCNLCMSAYRVSISVPLLCPGLYVSAQTYHYLHFLLCDTSSVNSTIASVVYGTSSSSSSSTTPKNVVVERHRHRYEVNPALVSTIEAAGLVFSGKDETGERMEICELPRDQHPFFFGTQFHPEFKSRPNRPSPPFFGFLAVCAGQDDNIGQGGKVSHAHCCAVVTTVLFFFVHHTMSLIFSALYVVWCGMVWYCYFMGLCCF